jgi:uncharacterized protein (TIGR01244 family)
MLFERAITSRITIGDQPSEEDLARLKAEGYSGVVNLRNDGEPEQPIGTAAEGELARAIGLDYLHVGIGAAPLTEEGVGRFCDFMGAHADAPVLVHCRSGGRAAALLIIQQAKANGWKPSEAIAKGDSLGLRVGGGLRIAVENYLNDHPTA